jgi:glutamate-1-semialdehyde 2,1-aminomutase
MGVLVPGRDEKGTVIGDRNHSLFEGACAVIPGGVNTSLRRLDPPLVFRGASGAMIWDADGEEYIDYHAAFGPILLGHCYGAVDGKVAETISEIDLLGVGTTELEIEVGRKICQLVPSAEKVLFCNSGSEATFSAIRLARAVTGKKKVIKFQGCYHGWHDAVALNVISVTEKLGKQDPLSAGSLEETLNQTVVCDFNRLETVEDAVKRHRGEMAAVIVEPIPHNIGCVLPKPGFLEGLREITKREGIILIFDEVITGFRHALGGYQEVCSVKPDLTTLGKAMANGYPMAALCGRSDLMDRFATHPGGDVLFAGTYNGHPLSCAATLATIRVLESAKVHPYIFSLGDKMRRELAAIAQRLGIRATVAGFGSVFLLYFMEGPIESYTDLLRNDAQRFVKYRRGLMKRGVFELPLNLKRSHISFSHTEEHINRSLNAAEDALKEIVS